MVWEDTALLDLRTAGGGGSMPEEWHASCGVALRATVRRELLLPQPVRGQLNSGFQQKRKSSQRDQAMVFSVEVSFWLVRSVVNILGHK